MTREISMGFPEKIFVDEVDLSAEDKNARLMATEFMNTDREIKRFRQPVSNIAVKENLINVPADELLISLKQKTKIAKTLSSELFEEIFFPVHIYPQFDRFLMRL